MSHTSIVKTETTISNDTQISNPEILLKGKNEGVAALLSLIIPGVGQIYNGRFIWAIFWMIITPGFWIGSISTLGVTALVLHFLSAIHAYRQAVKKNYELGVA